MIKGEFYFENGKLLDFLVHTKDLDFKTVLDAFEALKDECERQINFMKLCPFYEAHIEKN